MGDNAPGRAPAGAGELTDGDTELPDGGNVFMAGVKGCNVGVGFVWSCGLPAGRGVVAEWRVAGELTT